MAQPAAIVLADQDDHSMLALWYALTNEKSLSEAAKAACVNEQEAKMDARTHKMPNGATVSDWLGTAATAAKVAGMYLDDVRLGVAGSGKLNDAAEQLEQAAEELRAIKAELALIAV